MEAIVGQRVLYQPLRLDRIENDDGMPLAAIICHVIDEKTVNLVVFDMNGQSIPSRNVPLVESESEDVTTEYCYPAFRSWATPMMEKGNG